MIIFTKGFTAILTKRKNVKDGNRTPKPWNSAPSALSLPRGQWSA